MAEYEVRITHEFIVQHFRGEMVVDNPNCEDQRILYKLINANTGDEILFFEGQLEDFKRIFTDMMNVRSRYDGDAQ